LLIYRLPKRYSGERDRKPLPKGDGLMRKKTLKSAALAGMASCLLQFGGCLNMDSLWGRALWDAALYTGWEYALDGGIEGFDLLGGGDNAE